MQRIAQDWLVLTQLTNHSGTAVGIVMALQFGPPLILMPIAGMAVDHFDRRRILLITQSAMALCALILGLLVIAGQITLWAVYIFAGAIGCISAFDSPARQTFFAELVGDEDLPNAVALNASIFNSAQLIGPAISGILISIIGVGWVFIINALSFAGVIISLLVMRVHEFCKIQKTVAIKGGILEGFKYIKIRPDIFIALLMLFIIGTYGLNFPIFISTMSLIVFQGGAHLYGILSSMMAIGSVVGALYVAGRKAPNLNTLVISSFGFGIAGVLAAVMPNGITFGLMLLVLGTMSQIFTTSANGFVQLSTAPMMRGRIMAIYIGIFFGCTPLGAPLMGSIADRFGPRWSLGAGACAGFIAGLIGLIFKLRKNNIDTLWYKDHQ